MLSKYGSVWSSCIVVVVVVRFGMKSGDHCKSM
jgi:hypothetical protein